MACYYPLTAYRGRELTEKGKRKLVFDRKKAAEAYTDIPLRLACGQCIGCRLDRSRQWAVRCVHEASLHEENCFITLTYNDEHLPGDRSLNHRDFQTFMKRLRKKFGSGIRFYMCGEYGEQYGRPHYHACLFNHSFKDQYFWKLSPSGENVFRSDDLEDLWSDEYGDLLGHCSTQEVNFRSAAYVARYIMKKVSGDAAEDHYVWVDPSSGECHELYPEYTQMSRRGGIGRCWLDTYHKDVYPDDFVIIDGKKVKTPKAYDRIFEELHPAEMEKIKKRRATAGRKNASENTPERLRVREIVLRSKTNQLKRGIDQ